MSNKFDIKTANVVIGTQAGTVSLGIGIVPPGKTRFITFVKAANINHIGIAPTNTLYLAKNAADSITGIGTAMTNKKLTIPFKEDVLDSRHVPNSGPNIDNPLFTIDASHYLIGCASRKSIDVFVQYYDD